MKAARVSQFGSIDAIQIADVPLPLPAEAQIRVQVKAAGVGPWDVLVREGHSGVPQTLPLTLGSDIAGIVDAVGPGVSNFRVGDEVYGLTNGHFTGGYAEYALASASSMARMPDTLNFLEAASAPVVAVTAWQMLFDYARAASGQKVLIHGGAGNVGAYAVQLARNVGLNTIATASTKDLEYVLSLGADAVVDYRKSRFEDVVSGADIVLDTVGGETLLRSLAVLKPGGVLVSIVSSPLPLEEAAKAGVKVLSFIVNVTTARLNTIAGLFDAGKLKPQVGSVLPLRDARVAHQMLAGAPHARGKIVLRIES